MMIDGRINVLQYFRSNLQMLLLLSVLLLFVGCENEGGDTQDDAEEVFVTVPVPKFEQDSAYNYIQKQVDFGPRVPNTEAHRQCKDWFISKFNEFGAEVIAQDFQAEAFTGEIYNGWNIIAQYNPKAKKRVLLGAHWDSRHMADSPLSTERHNEAIPGADDGASGVGVLLEVARNLQASPMGLGIDIILFDAEDNGDNGGTSETMFTWCLGAQHWAKNKHVKGYRADYGILLDMVGSKGARFAKDNISMKYAAPHMNKFWQLAQAMGKGKFFVNEPTTIGIDDHYIVNTVAMIPMFDIINKPKDSSTGFGLYWHTHDDNMDVIDKTTLQAVGQVLLAAIYRENNGTY